MQGGMQAKGQRKGEAASDALTRRGKVD